MDIEDAFKTLDSLIQEQIRMATTQVVKVNSEIKEGALPCQQSANFTSNPCPFRCQESRLGYSERREPDNLFVIRYFHCFM